ncbi:MAG TPA: sigma-70 family RNA polymerase sigma factor [Ruminococcus flavefaciens]|nr:sigma-70 family RNA polymerase sigma factor [Ruminococcus flavefaciens]
MIAACFSLLKNNSQKNIFEQMYLKNRNIMMHISMQILNNRSDAEDCVSEAFLRAARNFEKFSSLDCPKQTSLLVIIVRNISIDKYRANKKIFAAEAPEELSGTVSFDSYSFDSVVFSIKQLKDEYRDILMLRFVYGYSVSQITDMLNISAENVYKRLQRAKSALKKEPEGGEENNGYEIKKSPRSSAHGLL